jgi:hypothetical protein
MDGIFTNDESTQGHQKKWVQCKDLELEKMDETSKIGLYGMQIHLILKAPIDDEENLLITKFVNGARLLNSDDILYGGQEVERNKHVPTEHLEDMGTSSAAPNEVVASEERHVVEDDVLSTNPTSSLYNQRHVQSGKNRAPAYYDVIPSGMDGIYAEVNAPIPGVGSINTYDPPCASL